MSLPGFRSLVAVLESGFESAGFVMGAISLQLLLPVTCFPVGARLGAEPLTYPDYEQAVRSAWWVAVERLGAEAIARGAHGVVGVTAKHEVDGTMVSQLSMFGSAVRVPGLPPLQRPFLSMLSMDDTLKLLLGGWVPSGIGFGFSAVHVHGWAASPFMQGAIMENLEMVAPSMGMQLARQRAEADMRWSLQTSRAEGAVASTLTLNRYPQGCGNGRGVLIEGRLVGTGIIRYREPAETMSAVRNLAGGRLR